jgi:hypothetical protein
MSDEKDCCCKECGAPTGQRKGAGKALPSGSGEGTAKMMLVGAESTDAVTGEPVGRPFRAGPNGEFIFAELPHGQSGTYVNDNLTEVLLNGRIISRTITGSGAWSKTA